MEQRHQRTPVATSSVAARLACAAVAVLVLAAAAAVVEMRRLHRGEEPTGQNWWLVAWLVVGLAFGVTGAALASRRGHRLLGAAFLVAGAAAAVTAVATQYAGWAASMGGGTWRFLDGAADWSRPVAAGALVGIAPWALGPGGRRRHVTAALALTAAAVVATAWAGAVSGPGWVADGAAWAVASSGTLALARLGRWWRQARRVSDDPLAAWLLAGVLASWLAFVPDMVDLGEWTVVGRHVVSALLLLATAPLLVGGAVVQAIRDSASPLLGISHRVLEWVVLAGGIVAVYTGLVAGLGRLVGGSGPTWLLVGATGAIAVALEPARRHVRRLVDRLVYGTRDDPLAVVQRVVDHLGAESGDRLLPALVESLRDELRLDSVTIDLRVDDGWRTGASTGRPTPCHRVVPLRHRGEVVGRLVVGWAEGPSLRERDELVLQQLAGPVSLAVGWVRLAEELRRSSVAIVSAREEERRRLRRDLHDGLGPSLTGVSLGLRTALRQLDRTAGTDPGPAPRALLGRVADEIDAAVGDLKRVVRALRPTALDQLGLVDAVAEFTRGFGDAVEMHLTLPEDPVALPAAVEVATYRIVTEAVTNVVRHAHAAGCWLSIAMGPSVVIDVVDDGVGIAADGRHGVGLTAMRERAAELGGSVELLPNLPHGTRVHVQLPAALP